MTRTEASNSCRECNTSNTHSHVYMCVQLSKPISPPPHTHTCIQSVCICMCIHVHMYVHNNHFHSPSLPPSLTSSSLCLNTFICSSPRNPSLQPCPSVTLESWNTDTLLSLSVSFSRAVLSEWYSDWSIG